MDTLLYIPDYESFHISFKGWVLYELAEFVYGGRVQAQSNQEQDQEDCGSGHGIQIHQVQQADPARPKAYEQRSSQHQHQQPKYKLATASSKTLVEDPKTPPSW